MGAYKFDVQPNLQKIASALGVDVTALSTNQRADGAWVVNTPDTVATSVIVAIEAQTAVDNGLAPSADILDVISDSGTAAG